jgi:hypothetical protein
MQLDIRFWRGRWWWQLAVKAAVRFFRPQTSIEGSDVINGHFK